MKTLFAIGFLLIPFLASSGLQASEEVRQELRQAVDTVLEKLYGEDAVAEEDRTEAVRSSVQHIFSFYAISRRALGRNWNQLEAEQQERFVSLFTDRLVSTYADRYQGDEPPEVSWGKVNALGERRMEVFSTVTVDGATAEVVYRLAKLEERWQVYDVVAEGVSLVSNYRSQFNEIMARSGPDGLLTQLERE